MLDCRKEEFYLPADFHFLNCAYLSPQSRRVEAAGQAALQRKRNPADIRPKDFFTESDHVRRLFAELIGAKPSSIALVPSVSYGLASIAKNLPVVRNQKIVLLNEQFPSNVYTWRRLAGRHGAKIVTVEPPEKNRARGWNERILNAIDRETAIVALPNVHWTDGTLFDLEAIGERARSVGAALVVDGTQSVGALPFHVERVRPDAIVCAGYKWLFGPYSTALAYIDERHHNGVPLEENWITRRRSEEFSRLVDYEDQYQPGAVRFDVGERSNFALLPMLAAALDQIQEWGPEEIQKYCRALTSGLIEEARTMGYEIEDESGRASHLFGIRMRIRGAEVRLRDELEKRNVAVSVRGSAVRVAPHVYNDEHDVEALLDALRAVAGVAV
ncbi:MAG: aminotransferase class V-fold PLP-dependent enzyme [Rhodothermales bacterium]